MSVEGEARPQPLPWQGRPQRADLICWFGIALSGVYYLAMLPVRPLLIGKNPLLLELITGSLTSIVTAGAFARVGEAPLLLALLAAVPATMMFDPLYWWAGRRWGRAIIEIFAGRSARSKRGIARAERMFRRFGWPAIVLAYFLPVPTAIVYAFAGWSGMRLVTFLILDVLGTLMWVGTLVALGYALGERAVHVAKEISHYGLLISIGLIVVMVVLQYRRMR